MDEIISYKMCAVKVRNAKRRKRRFSKTRTALTQSCEVSVLFFRISDELLKSCTGMTT
jgi:hypothetical protein